jgi:copper chaperone CopZ
MSMVAGVSPAAPGGAVRAVELAIGGMTCASCAARVEKKLSKLDGVSATVNFATGTARVSLPLALPATELISVVEQAGYTAALPSPPRQSAGGAAEEDGADETSALRQRLLVSSALATPGGRAGDDPGIAVPELGVGLPGAGFPGGRVGGVAVPPGYGPAAVISTRRPRR